MVGVIVVLALLSYGYMFVFLILGWLMTLPVYHYILCINTIHSLLFIECRAFF